MKEKILKVLRKLGFELEETPDEDIYGFEYEGINMIYICEPENDEMLCLAVPGIYSMEDDNMSQYNALLDTLNYSMRYAKAYTVADKLWLFYEREALEGEDLDEIIQRMILRLQKGFLAARTILERMDSAEEDSLDNDE